MSMVKLDLQHSLVAARILHLRLVSGASLVFTQDLRLLEDFLIVEPD